MPHAAAHELVRGALLPPHVRREPLFEDLARALASGDGARAHVRRALGIVADVSDAEQVERLVASGWSALVVWECELADEVGLIDRLQAFLGRPRLSLK